MLKSFLDAKPESIAWTQVKGQSRRFEIRSGDEMLATLTWEKGRGALARAETAEGSWTFKRVGFWRPRIVVRAAGADRDLATFERGIVWSGTLEIAGANRFLWAHTGFFRPAFEFRNQSDEPLVRFKRGRSFLKAQGLVELTSAARIYKEVPLLVALGLYLVILIRADSRRAAVMAGS